MARAGQLHSEDIKLEQKPTIILKKPAARRPSVIAKRGRVRADGAVEVESARADDREGEIIRPGKPEVPKEYLEKLAFMNEPVTIMLERSQDKNSATVFPVWVNGEKAPMLMPDGKWFAVGWLPVGEEITIKRSALEVILRCNITTVEANYTRTPDGDTDNFIKKFSSPIHAVSILEDKNPKGNEWARRVRRTAY
jgi:hypothetical protein